MHSTFKRFEKPTQGAQQLASVAFHRTYDVLVVFVPLGLRRVINHDDVDQVGHVVHEQGAVVRVLTVGQNPVQHQLVLWSFRFHIKC